MIKEKITILTTQSTPLQLKTVQLQQTVEKLSAELLQLGLSRDPQEVKLTSAAIDRHRKNLDTLVKEIGKLKSIQLETSMFSEMHEQVLKATDEKFASISVFKDEAAKVNVAMARIDKSLVGMKEIIAGLSNTAARRAGTATKTLNESISDRNSVPELLANVQNYRNEVDNDIELNKSISAISDLVFSIGVDTKLLDAKARMIMLSGNKEELDMATAEVVAIQTRINKNIVTSGKSIKEIKSSGFVDEAIAAISGAMRSAEASLQTIASSQRKVLNSIALVDTSLKKVRELSLEQSRKSEANVQSTAMEQQRFIEQVTSRVDHFRTLLIGISLGIIALVLLLSCSTVLSIVRPLNRLSSTIVTVADTGDFSKTVDMRSNDEVGITATAFNRLIDSFVNIIATIAGSHQKLTETSRDLNCTAQKIHETVAEQSGKVAQLSAAAVEMTQSITFISSNTSHIANSATAAKLLAESGAEVVNQTSNEVQEISRTVEESTRAMQSLNEKSKQVGEIVDVIMNITEQTNLLALNAAIEAARAGEHGRGFAVVADEVRKLATNTAEATVGITERVNSIRTDTDQAVKAMDKSLEMVKKGVDFSEQAGESLRQIVSSVSQLQDMACGIASATNELSLTSEQISADIIGIEHVSAKTVKAAETVTEESDALARLSVELRNEISRFTCTQK
jgi:methyl-accepting chemotaxis protein